MLVDRNLTYRALTKTNFPGFLYAPDAGQPLAMKVLILCKKFPYPLHDGESQAIHGLSKSLSELGVEVSLLAMNTSKHYYAHKALPEAMSHYKAVRTVAIDTAIRYGAALKHLAAGRSYHISRFDQPAYRESLSAWLQEEAFDVVQLETLYLAPYIETIRAHSKALVAMRAHNVESEIWERVCSNTRFFPKRWYLRKLSKQLKAYEVEQLNNYDLLLPISRRDEHTFKRLGHVGKSTVLPIGLDTGCGEPNYEVYRTAPTLSFIGSLDWMPNIEGLQWFLSEVWPGIHARFPHLEFHIAGRNMPDQFLKLKQKNVLVHGEVPSACDFVNQHSISVVPLLSGGGMRAKILEAMSLGRTVLSTSIGLEGIRATHQKDVLVADTPSEFLNLLKTYLSQPRQLEQLGRNAAQTFVQQYDRLHLAEGLLRVYHQELGQAISVKM